MLDPYVALLLLGLIALGFLVSMIMAAQILGPKNQSPTKQLPFECGSVEVGSVQEQRFNVRFYLVAVMFILFDIEVIFMYPWAVNLGVLGWPGFFAMLTFVFVLMIGFVYAWKKGVLNWND